TGRPHARGDGPLTDTGLVAWLPQAPRTWGWTGQERRNWHRLHAGPTHVGMDRTRGPCRRASTGRPHARGDGPGKNGGTGIGFTQAPRTWGWTAPPSRGCGVVGAGPTHVGMDRTRGPCRRASTGRPHARGDGPALCW